MHEKDESKIADYRNDARDLVGKNSSQAQVYAILAVVEALIKIHDRLEDLGDRIRGLIGRM